MGGDVVYREVQHWWRNPLLAVLLPAESVITGVVLLPMAAQAPPARAWTLVGVWLGVGVVLPGLFLLWRMVTEVTADELRVRFAGLPGWRIRLDSVETAEPEKVDPLFDLGGWGWRWTRSHGWIMNVAGDRVVRVTLVDGRKRTVGTRDPEGLARAILAGAIGEPVGPRRGHSVEGTSKA